MPNFLVLVRSLRLSTNRNWMFSLLLAAVLIVSVYKSPQAFQSSSVIYSQDTSLIADLPAQRHQLEYLLLAQPLADFPHYILKYKDQPKLISVKIPQSTQINLEREVLLKNGIPYAIATDDWLKEHNQAIADPELPSSFWRLILEFFQKNLLGLSLLALALFVLRKGFINQLNGTQIVPPEKLKGSMDDLVGMEDIKREVLHLESMINQRHLYKSHNIDKPFNIMLTGPAGTGKTKLAGYLAKTLNIPLIQIAGSNLESGLVGGGSKTLNAIYKKACSQKRCLIFLDEAQSLFMPRGRSDRRWDDDTANTLLGLLDGIKNTEGQEIIWIVASNFDDANSDMDEAMLRRFAVKINFRLPNKAERKELLSVFLRRKDTSVIAWERLNLDDVAAVTANLSPALLETVVDRASLIAIEEECQIDTSILFRAFERSTLGLTDRATLANKDKQRERVAIHELGHFFMQIDPLLKQGLSLDQVKKQSTLLKISTESVSKLGALGFVLSSTNDHELHTLDDLENEVMQLYGGVAAEELFYGARGISVGSQNDIQKATSRLELMINQLSMYSPSKLDYRQLRHGEASMTTLREVEKKSEELYRKTLESITSYESWIIELKRSLMENYVLSKDEVFHQLGFIMKKSIAQVIIESNHKLIQEY
jgi:cell division protease FtsH